MSTWEPIDDRSKPASRPTPTPLPRHPTRPPPPPPQLARFRPDRPRQPELLQPYQLRPKRGKVKPPVEQPPSNPKQIKRMKKKLGKLNKKIRQKINNNLISK